MELDGTSYFYADFERKAICAQLGYFLWLADGWAINFNPYDGGWLFFHSGWGNDTKDPNY